MCIKDCAWIEGSFALQPVSFAKTLTDFEINYIAAALLPLFCYNS